MTIFLFLIFLVGTNVHADINKQLIEIDLKEQIKEPWDNCTDHGDCKLIPAKCGVSLAINASFEPKVKERLSKDQLRICHDFVGNNSPYGVRCEYKKCVLVLDDPKTKSKGP